MKRLDVIEWLGSALAISAALILALNIEISGWGFIIYAVSNFAWIYAAISRGNRPLLWMNGVFLLINIIGISRWLF